MKKLNLEIRKKLIPFFKSEDFETILLGISLFKTLPEYKKVKNVYVYTSVIGKRTLNEALDYIENGYNIQTRKSISLCVAGWLKTQEIQ